MSDDLKKDNNDIKEQLYKENSLFHSRTGAFLVTNGLLFTALGNLDKTTRFDLLISALGIIISILWYKCMKHSINVMKALIDEIEDEFYVINLIEKILGRNDNMKPDELLGKILPCIFICFWALIFICNYIY